MGCVRSSEERSLAVWGLGFSSFQREKEKGGVWDGKYGAANPHIHSALSTLKIHSHSRNNQHLPLPTCVNPFLPPSPCADEPLPLTTSQRRRTLPAFTQRRRTLRPSTSSRTAPADTIVAEPAPPPPPPIALFLASRRRGQHPPPSHRVKVRYRASNSGWIALRSLAVLLEKAP
ncbi:TANK-binding kinase 1-binding protein 1-like [Arachis ipaensis]|uniref:TANK-binding kinase 1-binding protein 1-like n=1 Tax=Arachis ipaensis TaxID=130454 RepID=UPI000A2B8D23|nr:TANK-binding kinase 1-binding protein 1-like [Arachis ipaensis]